MNVTATTRLTAAQCMERLAELPALPRGERLCAWSAAHEGHMTAPPSRPNTTWEWLMEYCAPPSVMDAEMWPSLLELRRWAAPVRRLRDERRALKEQLRQARTLLAFERACYLRAELILRDGK